MTGHCWDEETLYALALTRLSGFNTQIALQLYKMMGSATELYENRNHIDEAVPQCSPRLKKALQQWDDALKRSEAELELMQQKNIRVLKYNDENSLSCVLTMAYFTAPAYYNIVREFPAGKGYADMVLIPRRDSGNKPAIVIELKWNKDADAAIRQIKEKRYAGELSGYTDKILLVGITYDKETKHHECVIEEY